MKSLLIIIVSFFCFQITLGQSFVKRYETAHSVGYIVPTVIETIDSGYIYANSIDSCNYGCGHIFLFKTDGNGDTMWTSNIYLSDSGKCEVIDIAASGDSSFVSTGIWKSVSLTDTIKGVSLIKYDFYGNIIWNKVFTDPAYSADVPGFRVIECYDGGFLIGSSHLIRTDSNGNLLWVKKYPSSNVFYIGDVAQLTDSGFVFHTSFMGISSINRVDKNGDLLWRRIFSNMNQLGKILAIDNAAVLFSSSNGMIALDSQGDSMWTRITNVFPSEFIPFTSNRSATGDFLIAGRRNIGSNLCMLRIDQTGNLSSIFEMNAFSMFPYFIKQTYDHGYIIGSKQAIVLPVTGISSVPALIKADSLFSVNCIPSYGSASAYEYYTDPIIHDSDLVTDIDTFNTEFPTNWAITHACNVIDICSVTNITDAGTLEQIKLFPNPSKGLFQIETERIISSVSIKSIDGKEVYQGDNSSIVDLSGCSSGIYLVYVRFADGSSVNSKIILEGTSNNLSR